MVKPARICPRANCPNTVPCADHPNSQRYPYSYSSQAHRQWRDAVLARAGGRCQAQGCTNPATHADHIDPIALGGPALDIANGQALCPGCHSKKTRADDVLPRYDPGGPKEEPPTPTTDRFAIG